MLNDQIESVSEREMIQRNPSADGPRRKYTLDFKLKVLQEAMAPGASIAPVALRHNMNTNVVFRWRKLFREGRLTGEAGSDNKQLPPPAFVPVQVVPDAPALPAPQTSRSTTVAEPKPPQKKPGIMAITLPGGFTLRVDPDIDEAALRRALRAVRDLSLMNLPPGTKVYVCCRPTDMRKGFDGLSAQVSHILHADPYSG
jgi:transposase